MRRTPTQTRRSGFTLVELLVVITILAILFALSAAAVMGVISRGQETQVRSEISQLAASIQAFKTDFSVSYIPSQIILPPGADSSGESTRYITSLWPRIASNTSNPLTTASYWGISTSGGVTLQGHQALVFFLGGARVGGAPIGFSSSPNDPMETTSTSRKGPYYDFPPNRLQLVVPGNPYPSFIDSFGTAPYLYFSSKKAGNDYDYDPVNGVQMGMNPYLISQTPMRFANPNGFQIVSAGKDGVFDVPGRIGGATNWAGATGGAATAQSADNIANFYPTRLGIAPQ